MAAKKKSDGNRGMDSTGKVVGFKPVKAKPTEAITAPGQKATGLGKSNTKDRFNSGAKGTGTENMAGAVVQKTAELIARGAINLSGAGDVADAIMKPTKKNILSAGISIAAAVTGEKAVTAGVKAADESAVLGKKVVHGSPVEGLKKIEPQVGSAARPTEKVAYGWNPKAFKDKRLIENVAGEYAKGGSVYVGKVPRSGIVKDANEAVVVSKKPIRVTKEIKVSEGNVGKKIDKAIPGSTARKVERSLEAKKRDILRRMRDKNSPV